MTLAVPMSLLGKITTPATAVVCAAALAISIYPGRLNALLFFAALLGTLAAPFVVTGFAISAFTQRRRGNLKIPGIPWKRVAIPVLMLVITFAALLFYIPRRIAFAACQSSFERIVDDGIRNNREFNRRIGPYQIDECLTGGRGGVYLRVYSGADGPDVMSWGFCHNPARDSSPFGAAHYKTYRLSHGWYWFRASNDWF